MAHAASGRHFVAAQDADHLQDPTNHPAWTGKQVTDIKEESRAAKFLTKYGSLTVAKTAPSASDGMKPSGGGKKR
jgi:hypothetical protein